MTLTNAILSCGFDGIPTILQVVLPGADKTSGTKRWTIAALATAFSMANQSTRRWSTPALPERKRMAVHRNLKFAILDQLMDSGSIPRFDVSAFFLTSRGVEYDPNADYDFAPLDDVADHLAKMSLDDSTLCQMTELDIYAGNELQHIIFPQWSGEDDYFDIPTLDGIERCAGLQSLSIQLLPPNDPADITAVAQLENLTNLSFNGGMLTTLAPLLGCARLAKLEFIVTSINDADDNRTIVSGLRSRGCEVSFTSPRNFSC